MLKRLALIGVLAAASSSAVNAESVTAYDRAVFWAFMNRFVTPEGAVIDTQNDQMSHSEGQGYGLLIAVASDDQRQFDQLYQWTQNHLAVRDDGLLAWSWDREQQRVSDRNAATDGDILVAWALLRAAERWDETRYRDAALRHIDAIEAMLIQRNGRWLVLPGPQGFKHAEGTLTVNPSYWVFPAFLAFEKVHKGPWRAVAEDGVALIQTLLQRYAAVPDWVRIQPDGEPGLSDLTQPAGKAGFDAIRVPLYLHWAGLSDALARQHWQGMQALPTDQQQILVRDADEPTIHLAGLHLGYSAVGQLVMQGRLELSAQPLAYNYYPAALQLLSLMATQESR